MCGQTGKRVLELEQGCGLWAGGLCCGEGSEEEEFGVLVVLVDGEGEGRRERFDENGIV